jgi:phosphoheptose isomerase
MSADPVSLRTRKACAEHSRALTELAGVLDMTYDPAVAMLLHCLAEGKKILTCGNGGSAMQAQHMAAEFVVRFETDRRALPCLALSADPAIVTACGNDYGYDRVFSRQVEAYGNPGDCLVAFSTSGRSRNVAEAVLVARNRGLVTLGISGNKGLLCGPDVDIVVPSTSTARVQEMHLLIVHLLLEGVERGVPS